MALLYVEGKLLGQSDQDERPILRGLSDEDRRLRENAERFAGNSTIMSSHFGGGGGNKKYPHLSALGIRIR